MQEIAIVKPLPLGCAKNLMGEAWSQHPAQPEFAA
jgi:hypothetical protein